MNPKQVSKVVLNPETVDCFVFWIKNANPMISRLEEIKDYNYYFQYTITGYRNEIERGIKDKLEIIEGFKMLSKLIGREKVILRYDPIFINEKYTINYHIKAFRKLCTYLEGYTDKCVISFIDIYSKIKKNMKIYNINVLDVNEIYEIAKAFSGIAREFGIELETCSESYDLSEYNIKKGKCIDAKLISNILGYEVNALKDSTQREVCGCIKSVDIGQYNTCINNCAYCYENYNSLLVKDNYLKHNVKSPLLSGELRNDAKITLREMKTIKGNRLNIKK